MRHFVVSDLHIGHGNVIIYEPIRAELLANWITAKHFPVTKERIIDVMKNKDDDMYTFYLSMHDDMIIEMWNSVIKKDDVVFFLGDLCLSSNKDKIRNWAQKLNGRKRLIKGNHDVCKDEFYLDCGFETVSRYPILFNQHIFLSHEPLPKEIVSEGYINFFGHVHSNTTFNWDRGICVSIEQLNNLQPICINAYIGNKEEIANRHNTEETIKGQLSIYDFMEEEND